VIVKIILLGLAVILSPWSSAFCVLIGAALIEFKP
jgi:hypothetical protein